MHSRRSRKHQGEGCGPCGRERRRRRPFARQGLLFSATETSRDVRNHAECVCADTVADFERRLGGHREYLRGGCGKGKPPSVLRRGPRQKARRVAPAGSLNYDRRRQNSRPRNRLDSHLRGVHEVRHEYFRSTGTVDCAESGDGTVTAEFVYGGAHEPGARA